MNDQPCRQFFLQPEDTLQRRYEALRASFLECRPLAEVAERFGYRLSSLKSMVCRFRASCTNGEPSPFFFQTHGDALPVGDERKMSMDPNRQPSPIADS